VKKKLKFLLVHGPNLNLLGTREPEIYGSLTLSQINQRLRKIATEQAITLKTFQANGEGQLIDFIHRHRNWADALVINPGAYTHYSYALRDAIAAINIPTIEVHLSDLSKRESFRRKSVIKAVCVKQISGLGWRSYAEGILELGKRLR